jgi:hypothetical protein
MQFIYKKYLYTDYIIQSGSKYAGIKIYNTHTFISTNYEDIYNLRVVLGM